jgi:hypothetical protein
MVFFDDVALHLDRIVALIESVEADLHAVDGFATACSSWHMGRWRSL